MAANFGTPDKYNRLKNYARIIFGDDAYLMETELNEMQKIQEGKLMSFIKNFVSDGFITLPPLRVTGGKVFLDPCAFVLDGVLYELMVPTGFTPPSTASDLYLAVWDQNVEFTTEIHEGGVVDAPVMDNGIFDTRAGEETSRRVQTQFQLTMDNAPAGKKYVLIGRKAAGDIIAAPYTDMRTKAKMNVAIGDVSEISTNPPLPTSVITTDQSSEPDFSVYGETRVNLLWNTGDFEVDGGNGIGVGWEAISSEGSFSLSSPGIYGAKTQMIVSTADITEALGVQRKVSLESGKYYVAIVNARTDLKGITTLRIHNGTDQLPDVEGRLASQVLYVKWQQPASTHNGLIQLYNMYPEGSFSSVEFDGAGVYEVPESIYNRIHVDITDNNIRDYLPHVNGRQDLNGVAIVKKGGNLIPPLTAATLATTAKLEGPYTIVLNATATASPSYIDIPVVIGQKYTFAAEHNGQVAVYRLNGTSLGTYYLPYTPSNAPRSFTADTATIRIFFSNNTLGAGTFRFTKPVLVLGETNPVFEPGESQTIYIPESLSSYGDVKDEISVSNAGEATLVRRVQRGLVIDANTSTTAVSDGAVGYRTLTAYLHTLKAGKVGSSVRFIRYDGFIFSPSSGKAECAYLSSESVGQMNEIRFTPTLNEAGWIPNLIPSDDAVKAFLNGWRAVNQSETAYTEWVSMIDGIYPPINTIEYVSKNKAPGWTHYATVDYPLANLDIHDVEVYGAINLDSGGNQITVYSGLVYREKVTFNKLNRTAILPRPAARVLDVQEGYNSVLFTETGTNNNPKLVGDVKDGVDYYATYAAKESAAYSTKILNFTLKYKAGIVGILNDLTSSVTKLVQKSDDQGEILTSLLPTISDYKDRITVSKTTPSSINAGTSLVKAERTTRFKPEKIGGRTLLNIIGSIGSGLSAKDWISNFASVSSVTYTIDFINYKVIQVGSDATVQEHFAASKYSYAIKENAYYLVLGMVRSGGSGASAYIRPITFTEGRASVTGDYDAVVPKVTDSTKLNLTAFAFRAAPASKLLDIRLQVLGESKYGYFKEIAVYEISASEYTAISSMTPEQISAMYPYTTGISGVENPYVISRSDNLAPPFYEWDHHLRAVISGPYAATIKSAADNILGQLWLGYEQPCAPNETYTFNVIHNGVIQLALFDANGMKLSGEYVTARTITVKAPANAVKIGIYIANKAGAGNFTFESAMLYIGSDVKPFKPQRETMIAFQTVLNANPGDGSSPDSLIEFDGTYRKIKQNELISLSGSMTWALTPDTYPTYKKLYVTVPQLTANGLRVTKYDGKELFLADASSGGDYGEDKYFFNASTKIIEVSVPNMDSGWGPDYNPTLDEIKAYFWGWRMCNQADAQLYNGTGTKCWGRISDPRNVIGVGGWNAQTALPKGPADADPNVSTYSPYKLFFRLDTPVIEPVPYEGTALLTEGGNQIEVGSGIVLREIVIPSPYSSGGVLTAYLFNTLGYPSMLKNKVEKLLMVYKNNYDDRAAWNFRIDNNSFGKMRADIPKDWFDPNASYSVTYTKFDRSPAQPVSGILAANENAQINDMERMLADALTQLDTLRGVANQAFTSGVSTKENIVTAANAKSDQGVTDSSTWEQIVAVISGMYGPGGEIPRTKLQVTKETINYYLGAMPGRIRGLAVDALNNVFVAMEASPPTNQIAKYSPNGTVMWQFTDLSSATEALYTEADPYSIYFGFSPGTRSLAKHNAGDGSVTWFKNDNNSAAFGLTTNGSNLYVCYYGPSGGSSSFADVSKYDFNGNRTIFQSDVGYAIGIAKGRGTSLYVIHGVDLGQKSFRRLEDTTLVETWAKTSISYPSAMTTNNLSFAIYVGNATQILKFDSAGNLLQTIPVGDVSCLTLDNDFNLLVGTGGGIVRKLDGTTGQEIWNAIVGAGYPVDSIVVDKNGNIEVGMRNAAIGGATLQYIRLTPTAFRILP